MKAIAYKKEVQMTALMALNKILIDPKIRAVIGFLPPMRNIKLRVKITRQKNCPNTFKVTIDKPCYEEREYLKLCKKTGALPRKYWLKFMPVKKNGGKK